MTNRSSTTGSMTTSSMTTTASPRSALSGSSRRSAIQRVVCAMVGAIAIASLGGSIGMRAANRVFSSADQSPAAAAAPAAPSTTAAKSPVLVELFTSEGCSSCPPADGLLAWLVGEQPVAGVEVIALGFHVDYWDQLGWRDRFSSPSYTARQDSYSRSMRSNKIYTPQMVVDGTHEFIGNDQQLARRFIGQAASAPKLAIAVDVQPATTDDGKVPLKIDVASANDATLKADVFVAVTEDGLVSDVQRGENARKRLTHVAVVRSIEKVGQIKAGEAFAGTPSVSVGKKWSRERVRLVVLVQQAKTGRVLGVTAATL